MTSVERLTKMTRVLETCLSCTAMSCPSLIKTVLKLAQGIVTARYSSMTDIKIICWWNSIYNVYSVSFNVGIGARKVTYVIAELC